LADKTIKAKSPGRLLALMVMGVAIEGKKIEAGGEALGDQGS
jgi:hypothetical protein